MFHIMIARNENIYIPPTPGKLFTSNHGRVSYHEAWVAKSFETMKGAQEALENIDQWFAIDGQSHSWLDCDNVYCLTGEGKVNDIFKEDRHIKYVAFIDDTFTKGKEN